MEKIIITNSRDQKLSAFLHKPTNQINKIIIITHSFKGDKDYQPIIGDFSRHICDEGYAVLRFDCWGSGESDGEFIDSSITTQIEDLKDVIQYAKQLGYTDICLIGLSLGTTDSIMAYDKSIKCMVLWSPVFQHEHLYEDYKEEILKNGYIIRQRDLTGEEVKCGKQMWQDFKDVKPYQRLNKIQCPVLAIIGSTDDHIAKEKAQEFMDMIPAEHELKVIEGGDHDFLIEEAKKKAIQHTSDFIKKYL
jgi:esterase/lipase